MTSRKRQIGALAAGAAALSLVGYTMGTQAGDGFATAAGGSDRDGDTRAFGPRGEPLADLAERLGVETSELRQALEDLRPDVARDDIREDLAAGLAEKLGLEASEVSAVLERYLPDPGTHHEQMAEALAGELGLEADAVESAFEKVHSAGPPRNPRQFTRRLARELDVSPARLREALMDVRPERPRRHALPLAEIAEALGVEEEQLQTALDELREEHEAEHEQRRAEFAQALADRLGIDVEKVEEALPEGPPHGGPGGPHGAPGFGGPPPPGGPGGPGFGGPPPPGGPFGGGPR